MNTYAVLKPLLHKGRHTKEGEQVELTEKQAAALTGRIVLVGPAASPAPPSEPQSPPAPPAGDPNTDTKKGK